MAPVAARKIWLVSDSQLTDGRCILIDERSCAADDSGLKVNSTIHKQISDLLEEAGLRGMTLHVSLRASS